MSAALMKVITTRAHGSALTSEPDSLFRQSRVPYLHHVIGEDVDASVIDTRVRHRQIMQFEIGRCVRNSRQERTSRSESQT